MIPSFNRPGSLFPTGGFGMHVSLDMFFDRAGVQSAMDEKTNRCMSNAGAFGRTVMQRGMRKRKKISAPGEYPSAHSYPLLRDKVRFGYDRQKSTLVVGPALLDRTDREVAAAGFTVPELVNYGGVVTRKSIYNPIRKRIEALPAGLEPVQWIYQPRPFVELTKPLVEKKLMENYANFPLRKKAG